MKIDYERLKSARLAHDWTQKELAEISGVHLSVIKAVETGRGADGAQIRKLAQALDVPFEQVYNENYRQTRIISVVNNKGGCGKTSVCGSLGFCLAEQGKRVLLVDADAQRNLTSSFNMGRREKHFGTAIELGESMLEPGYIVPTDYDHIDFIVADASMGPLDMVMFTKLHRENLVRQSLLPVKQAGIYDFILIDTNPNLSLLNFNIVNASDHIIIPVQMASFDIEGIGTVIEFIQGIQKFNPGVHIMGIVINRYDVRTRSITTAAEQALRGAYGDLLFKTLIRTDVKMQNAQWENKPVFLLGTSRIAKEYRELTAEVLHRV